MLLQSSIKLSEKQIKILLHKLKTYPAILSINTAAAYELFRGYINNGLVVLYRTGKIVYHVTQDLELLFNTIWNNRKKIEDLDLDEIIELNISQKKSKKIKPKRKNKDLLNPNLGNCIGIDEVGYGAIAGPMYMSAILLDMKTPLHLLQSPKGEYKESKYFRDHDKRYFF